ncbi:hypothetical protein OG426_00530 [Streptomyces canus]|nr:hypothetical protein [Streptomyces canus]MCX4853657.1 hypothetical protein [Streptomyces canus]WSW31104.1 hypothetical protein OG426_00530 [Streptomyces canus]
MRRPRPAHNTSERAPIPTLVRLLNGHEFESPRVELATTLVVRDSTARLG